MEPWQTEVLQPTARLGRVVIYGDQTRGKGFRVQFIGFAGNRHESSSHEPYRCANFLDQHLLAP
jgi:hypothetical protein